MSPLESLYYRLHRHNFERRLAKQRRFGHLYAISIGNLSVGGTGKTPLTLLLARYLRDNLPQPPLVVLRGYGGRLSSNIPLLVSVGDGSIELTAIESGDEAQLYAREPGVRVAIGRDRAAVVERFASPESGIGVVLLDDAFQNPTIYRDHDILLFDTTLHPEALRLLPLGRFREPLEALERASTLVLTKVDQAAAGLVDYWYQRLSDYLPTEAIFSTSHRVDPPTSFAVEPEGWIALCAIARPESFRASLASVGITPRSFHAFRDHRPFRPAEIEPLLARAESERLVIVTTEKDLVRLEALPERLLERLRARLATLPLRIAFQNRHGEEDRSEELRFLAHVAPHIESTD